MYIKHYDKEGHLSISVYLDNTPLTIKPSETLTKKYHVMMLDNALSGPVDLDEAEDIIDDLFDAISREQDQIDLTQDDNE